MKTIKSSLFILLFLVSLLFSFGCSQKTAVQPSSTDPMVQDYRKFFEFKLYSDKLSYKANEKIQLWATLKYTGNSSQIQIWHDIPYVSFTISDGRKFNTGGMFEAVLTSSYLEKDKLYQFDYQKTGGYDANDLNAPFWEKFYAEKDLYLPAGHYTVSASGAFSISKETYGVKNNLNEELEITVVQ